MQSGLGNRISMSPAGGVGFGRGDEISQKPPQTNTFRDIGTQWFFFHIRIQKAKIGNHFTKSSISQKVEKISL